MVQKLILNLLVLVTLFQRTSGDFVNIKDHEKIESESQLINNLVEYLPETVITSVVTVSDQNIDENKVRNIVKNLHSNENSGEDGIKKSSVNLRAERAAGVFALDDKLLCLSCFANGSTRQDQNCYKAQRIPTIKCAKKESCYSELNPDYVRRGCKLKSLLNRTHVCKCPLCNDKPFDDTSYYDYKNEKDWKHDNERLETPLVGIDLFCKVCASNGTNHTIDKTCKFGKNADNGICERNQLCYMNVDGKNNHVTRGCIDRPIYNSIYFFCQISLCNNKTLYHFKPFTKRLRILHIPLSAAYFRPLNIIHCLGLFTIINIYFM